MTTTDICSVCQGQFESTQEYLNHVCPATNHTPQEIEHQELLKPHPEKVEEQPVTSEVPMSPEIPVQTEPTV